MPEWFWSIPKKIRLTRFDSKSKTQLIYIYIYMSYLTKMVISVFYSLRRSSGVTKAIVRMSFWNKGSHALINKEAKGKWRNNVIGWNFPDSVTYVVSKELRVTW